ncbi:glycosyltransferase family 4 protein [Saccharopolyspora sp. 6T]|uniref:glycosyltransferase family 4 protein n=1 Tax=Saccharopolyspora sp. 6T TaxID=2877238 RepID=UPI001CD5AB02|nr:glycosyltransferase family 1 protein [Saccharopolyspora sp. 6T]MCA1188850.1 glycosyltransferase family 4 protein [Saccharopolyspora sp. 6T]
MSGPLRVLLDGTPLLGRRTGIGRYTASLSAELGRMSDVDARAIGFTARGWRALRGAVPPGVRATGVPVPARAVRALWTRAPFPPVELLAGTVDVVHGTNFALPPAVRAGGVVTVHDLAFLDEPAEAEPGFADLVRSSVRRAAVVCTPSAAVADSVAERFGLPRQDVVVTPLGVDPEWFDAVPPGAELHRLGMPDEYFAFVGAEGPRKGVEVLLRAHDRRLPPLVLAGPGEARQTGKVLRTGYLPEPELRSVVAGARALVLPSRDEGFGLPALEALACGVPVICSDLPVLREVTGGLAEFVPHGDAAALRAALQRAAAAAPDPAAVAARRAHAARFTWRGCAAATLHAYARAAS